MAHRNYGPYKYMPLKWHQFEDFCSMPTCGFAGIRFAPLKIISQIFFSYFKMVFPVINNKYIVVIFKDYTTSEMDILKKKIKGCTECKNIFESLKQGCSQGRIAHFLHLGCLSIHATNIWVSHSIQAPVFIQQFQHKASCQVDTNAAIIAFCQVLNLFLGAALNCLNLNKFFLLKFWRFLNRDYSFAQ